MVRGHGRVQEWPSSGRPSRCGVRSDARDGLTERLEAVYELGLRCTPLGVPDLKPFDVKTKRSPIIRANQAHPVSRRDREPASIAGVSETGTVPKLNRAVTRKAAIFNSVPNELSNDI